MKWDAVFREAAEGEKDWWDRHIKNPGMMVNCGVLLVRDCLHGDAHITTQKGGMATGTDAYTVMPNVVSSTGGGKGGATHLPDVNGQYQHPPPNPPPFTPRWPN